MIKFSTFSKRDQYILASMVASIAMREDAEQIDKFLHDSDIKDTIFADLGAGMTVGALEGGFTAQEVADAIISVIKQMYGE